ncbi:zinc-finger-containing protein [uncultured Alsobacter sp.]|uniref:zinc-finger-containing protein n=1 Tax=uncultured Alsobacter sp. TaxID=1748258 RepID=UPI0025CCF5B8|nr:zinc-finger-containing protein [uncultured Alsobacter sp.]
MTAPICCGKPTRLTTGAEVYPKRPDLRANPRYLCDECGAHVGCHPGTTKAVGTPAGPELRAARSKLHDQMFDPLWKTAAESGGYADTTSRQRKRIRQKARGRVYAFLAARMGLTTEECHIGHFDIEQCRAAWLALQGRTYAEIRAWAKSKEGIRT